MMGHLWKLALVVALSHGYRAAGRTLGPRWAGLITALPCSTAIALLGVGVDRGGESAVQMAGACWVGLAGASALPITFAAALGAGWGWFRAVVLAVASYFAVAAGVGLLGQAGLGTTGAALVALIVATGAAGRMPEPRPPHRTRGRALSPRQVLLLRTVVPVACLTVVIGIGERLGPEVAGYLGTFPGMTLTALLLTHLEAGPVPAVRMARALPPGNWAMVSFLAVFAGTARQYGLFGGTALGYLAALACLGVIARSANPPIWATLREILQARRRQHARSRPPAPVPGLAPWPRAPRRFSPGIEAIAAG